MSRPAPRASAALIALPDSNGSPSNMPVLRILSLTSNRAVGHFETGDLSRIKSAMRSIRSSAQVGDRPPVDQGCRSLVTHSSAGSKICADQPVLRYLARFQPQLIAETACISSWLPSIWSVTLSENSTRYSPAGSSERNE